METETQNAGAVHDPDCCGQKTNFIGVTERGGRKVHCSVCYKIQEISPHRTKDVT